MIVEKDGITDKSHLVNTILRFSSVQTTPELVGLTVDNYLEFAKEIYRDGVISGYALVFNFCGIRSFHGYKLVEGFGTRALRVAKNMIEKFGVKYITTTVDQVKTIRAARLLGFFWKEQHDDVLILGRG